MSSQGERLRKARERAGYASAAEAARAIGVTEPAYRAHENGNNGLSRSGERYARFFHVRFEWLMTGDGDMLDASAVPVAGVVGAGASVTMEEETRIIDGAIVALPPGTDCLAFVVKGDSQYPRFLDGEVVLVERRTRAAHDLVGHYAIVQIATGDVLLKLVRSSGIDRYRLESHNAPPIENVNIQFGRRYVAALPRTAMTVPPT